MLLSDAQLIARNARHARLRAEELQFTRHIHNGQGRDPVCTCADSWTALENEKKEAPIISRSALQ
jgi:hypothetical protein